MYISMELTMPACDLSLSKHLYNLAETKEHISKNIFRQEGPCFQILDISLKPTYVLVIL